MWTHVVWSKRTNDWTKEFLPVNRSDSRNICRWWLSDVGYFITTSSLSSTAAAAAAVFVSSAASLSLPVCLSVRLFMLLHVYVGGLARQCLLNDVRALLVFVARKLYKISPLRQLNPVFTTNQIKSNLFETSCNINQQTIVRTKKNVSTGHKGTRGVQKVLQLLYKNEPQTFKHTGIFEYSLLQHQCSFVTFLLCCLYLEKRILSPVPKTTLQQQL